MKSRVAWKQMMNKSESLDPPVVGLRFCILILVALLFMNHCNTLDGRADTSKLEKDVRQEITVGRALAARLIKRYGIVRQEELTRYITLVGRTLARRSSRTELQFYFGVLDTDEVNAYACPGGYILITRGALKQMRDEAELAGVLAHEISHIGFEHSGKFEDKSHWIDVLANFLAGGISVINSAVNLASEQLEKKMLEQGRQKSLELEADRAGALLASSLGYDPQGQVRYLQRIKSAGSRQTVFKKTHPPASERINQLNIFIRNQALPGSVRNASRFQSAVQF